MDRDPRLLRDLLLYIKDNHQPGTKVSSQKLHGKYPYNVIVEHLTMLEEEGLIEGQLIKTFSGRDFIPLRVTSLGYDYLEETRPLTWWEKILAVLKFLFRWWPRFGG